VPATMRRLVVYSMLLVAVATVFLTWFTSTKFYNQPTALFMNFGKDDPELNLGRIYSVSADEDTDHPNRIDNYDCLFDDCLNDDSLISAGFIIVT